MLKSEKICLAVLLITAFLLRFYNLGFQSLWLDELHTVIEADPSLKLSELFFYLKCCDQHPPLFYFIERFIFIIFGHSDLVARLFPAIAGTLSVFTLYLLGKEIHSKETGFIAALLTCFNYFNIYYSQEARNYILAFLLTALSFLFLLKWINNTGRKNGLFYILFTVLLLYTHYYGLFIFVSQAIIGGVYWLFFSDNKKGFIKGFALLYATVALCFAPWVPFILEMIKIKSFWIGEINSGFAIDYFKEFFGNNQLLYPFLIIFLLLYFITISVEKKDKKNNQKVFGFVVISIWITVTLLIPYLRSVITIPMLQPRYTIVILPAFILMMAMGIESIKHKIVRYTVVSIFLLISTVDLLGVKKYYTKVSKTQFREITAFIAANNSNNLPVINFITSWQFQYYPKRMGLKNTIIDGANTAVTDTIFNSQKPTGFWLVGAHGAAKPEETKKKKLESKYVMIKDSSFYDGWAQLYTPAGAMGIELPFESTLYYNLNNEKTVALWNGKVSSSPVQLKKGKYILNVLSKGSIAKNEAPRIQIYANKTAIFSFDAGANFELKSFEFEVTAETVVFDFELLNDYSDAKEDRNVFILRAFLNKKN